MRGLDGRDQQRQPRLLPARQLPDAGLGLRLHQAETGQPRAQPGRGLGRAKAADMVERGFVQFQLIHLMLREIADAQLAGPGDAAGHGGQPLGQQL